MRTGHIIIAGPGTGKTTELVSRVKQFLEQSGPNDKCIVSTFTRKAAEELTERISRVVQPEQEAHRRVLVGTIHSISSSLLKLCGDGKYDDREILSEEIQVPFIRSKLLNLGFGEIESRGRAGWNLARDCAAIFNKITDQRLHPNDIESVENIQRFLDAYPVYLELLKFEKCFDFATLQAVFLSEIQSNHEFVKRINSEFAQIFVDEYQDVNDLQADIFIRLMDAGADLVVVGDDDQSIYGFRGSRVQNMLEFPQQCAALGIPCTTSALTVNYRSTSRLVDSFNRYLDQVPYTRFDKKMTAKRSDEGIEPIFSELEDDVHEANFIVEKIQELKNLQLIDSYGQVAVLCNSIRNHASAIQNALESAGIPLVVSGNGGLLDTDFGIEIRLLLAFWLDKESALENLKNELHDQIGSSIVSTYSTAGYFQKLEDLKANHKYMGSCIALCYELFQRTDFVDRHSPHEQNLGTLTSLILSFDRFAGRFDPYGLQSYFSYLNETASIDYEIPKIVNGVVLTTIHRAKGLEFDVVFVASQNSRGTPPAGIVNRLDEVIGFGQTEIRSEKFRTFYVAISRARNFLYLSSSTHLVSTSRAYGPAEPLASFLTSGAVLSDLDLTAATSLEQAKGTATATRGDALSYNSVRTYELCPRQYWYAHVLRLETVRVGGMTFGTNMHRVIELVLRRFAQLGRVNQAEVDEIFADVWRDDPYRSPAENSTYFKAGQKQINLFVKNFVQKLDPNDSFDVETVFNVDMDGVAITGRFDMVRESDSQTEIIDFKTGDEGDYSNQLTLYSACRKIQTGSDVQKLTIYYLKTGNTVDVQPAPDSVWKSEIKRVSNGINGNNFSATPGKHCGDCSFKMICTMAK